MELREILEEREEIPKDEKLKKTTVILPQLVRIALVDLREKHNKMNWQVMTRRVIEHGFLIIQHEYRGITREIYELRKRLRYPEIDMIRNFMMDTKVNVDGMEKAGRKTVAIRDRIYSAIVDMSEELNIEISSMLRLCIYYSLSTSDELPKEVTDKTEEQKQHFRVKLHKTRAVLMGFEAGEKIWHENKDEWLKEKKSED